MIYEIEEFNAIKREPVLWRVPFFVIAKLLLLTLGGGVIGETIFSIIGLGFLGTVVFIVGTALTILVIVYFRSTKNKLTLSEMGRFGRNLSRIKEIR